MSIRRFSKWVISRWKTWYMRILKQKEHSLNCQKISEQHGFRKNCEGSTDYNKELEKERIWFGSDFLEKIAIDGGDRAGEYYMVCLLHVDATNRMYLHEVRTIKTDNTRSKTGASVGETNLRIPSASYPSSLSLRNKMMDVNTKFQLKKT